MAAIYRILLLPVKMNIERVHHDLLNRTSLNYLKCVFVFANKVFYIINSTKNSFIIDHLVKIKKLSQFQTLRDM